MTSLAHQRASEFFETRRRERRNIVTPEGVPIPVILADYSERVTAFFLDWLLWFVLLVTIFVAIVLTLRSSFSLIAVSVALFIIFLIRNLYFIYFEIAWRGSTPGKRIVGIRVIDRAGGPLLPSAVIARNLTREVEMFLPLGILIVGGTPGGGWGQLTIAAWLLFFAALPLINRDRMRGGDLIAGTMVIAVPKLMLLSDLVEGKIQFSFTEQQLRAYGAFELQVLEELLRRPGTPEGTRVLEEVCEKIRRKVDWPAPVPQNQIVPFLHDFYTAQRAFLEREQLYGKSRADKYAKPGAPG